MSNDAMRDALRDCLIMIGRIKKHCGIFDNAGYTSDGRMLKLSDVVEKAEAALAAPSAAPAQPVAWTARWHGSNPERGWSIYAGRDCIAYIGGDEGMSEAISEIVAAHNKCFDCDGGPCVMNCSDLPNIASDATKGGEANPDAQSEAKPVAWLSSFIHRHPDPHWRRIYTAHTSEKRARDYVSDLIDPKVEPLYTAPSAAPAPAGADALTDDEIVALAAPYCDDSGWMNGDQIFAFARAVRAKRGGAL